LGGEGKDMQEDPKYDKPGKRSEWRTGSLEK